ncbi:MAG: carboxypeptidase regulatory-like domain-containing protein [Myxococcota bacterium]
MRAVLLIVLLCAGGAAAQSAPTPQAPAPTARLFVTGGVAVRDLRQPFAVPSEVRVQDTDPTTLHASGAYFFSPWLGLDLEARGEIFYATRRNTDIRVPLGGFGLSAQPAFRWSPLAWLDLEAQLGWAVTGRPVISIENPDAPTGSVRIATGPTAGLVVGLEPTSWLSAQLFARSEVPLGSAVGIAGSTGVQLRMGALTFGDFRWGVALSYELAAIYLGSGEATLFHTEHRIGLGVALLVRKPAPPPPPPRVETNVSGAVTVTGTGAPIANAVVEVSGWGSVETDTTGAFLAREVPPGTLTVKATAKGFKVVSREVTVAEGQTARVELSLAPPTGPGQVTGVVLAAPDKPLAGVLVRADGGAEKKTGPDGAFTLEGVGPGPVTVTAALAGYEKGEEVVQVPPEATATVTLTLKATGVKAKATVKGLVVGSDGAVPKATVRVVELKKTVTVRGDGRFELEVPGGRYTLTIQAKGYVTQSKVVEVADGDQAIFHAELEKVRR